MDALKVHKTSTGYFLDLSKEVTIFFDDWATPKPGSDEIYDWEPHIVLVRNKLSVAMIYGRKMKEVQVALNRMKLDDNN